MDDQDPLVEQNEELQRFLGATSFGKQSKAADTAKRLEQSRRPTAVGSVDGQTELPAPKPAIERSKTTAKNSDEDAGDEEGCSEFYSA